MQSAKEVECGKRVAGEQFTISPSIGRIVNGDGDHCRCVHTGRGANNSVCVVAFGIRCGVEARAVGLVRRIGPGTRCIGCSGKLREKIDSSRVGAEREAGARTRHWECGGAEMDHRAHVTTTSIDHGVTEIIGTADRQLAHIEHSVHQRSTSAQQIGPCTTRSWCTAERIEQIIGARTSTNAHRAVVACTTSRTYFHRNDGAHRWARPGTEQCVSERPCAIAREAGVEDVPVQGRHARCPSASGFGARSQFSEDVHAGLRNTGLNSGTDTGVTR